MRTRTLTYVYDGVLEDGVSGRGVDDALVHGLPDLASLEVPTPSRLVVVHFGAVIAFVEIFQDGGKDLGCFVRQVDALAVRFEELRSAGIGEEGRLSKNVFVCGKESLLGPDADGHDGRVQVTVLGSVTDLSRTKDICLTVTLLESFLHSWSATNATEVTAPMRGEQDCVSSADTP